jgi:hypothetical protein
LVRAGQLFQRAEAHVSLFAAPPRKVSAAKMFRKPKEFAQHFKRHFLKRHLRVRVLPPQPRSRVSVNHDGFGWPFTRAKKASRERGLSRRNVERENRTCGIDRQEEASFAAVLNPIQEDRARRFKQHFLVVGIELRCEQFATSDRTSVSRLSA